ncbi:hypothetical protein SLT36_12405 [Aminobacter sp. BA135]|uniref:hypothetical protein n=1 Tax=Aminobacter sp. BA135 TaxID=537596 RepID=UPI003D7BC51C
MDNEQWRGRINNVIETLHGLDTDSFYDERDYSYYPIYGEIEQLATAFEINRDALSEVLARKPVARKCWLPGTPELLGPMSAMEIYCRLGENLADERWIDGALVEAFESGVLAVALQRLSTEVGSFLPKGG